MTSNYINPTKVVTGLVRFSYCNVWEPKSISGSAPKYSVSLIIKKSDTKTVELFKKAIQAAYEEGQNKLRGNGRTVPPLESLKTPLRDGDTERPDDEAYRGCWFVNANANADHKPAIVDTNCQQIMDHSEVYSGVYGRASVNCYAYNVNGNRGIACGLNHLMKVCDGPHLGSGSSAKSDFDDGFKFDEAEEEVPAWLD